MVGAGRGRRCRLAAAVGSFFIVVDIDIDGDGDGDAASRRLRPLRRPEEALRSRAETANAVSESLNQELSSRLDETRDDDAGVKADDADEKVYEERIAFVTACVLFHVPRSILFVVT